MSDATFAAAALRPLLVPLIWILACWIAGQITRGMREGPLKRLLFKELTKRPPL